MATTDTPEKNPTVLGRLADRIQNTFNTNRYQVPLGGGNEESKFDLKRITSSQPGDTKKENALPLTLTLYIIGIPIRWVILPLIKYTVRAPIRAAGYATHLLCHTIGTALEVTAHYIGSGIKGAGNLFNKVLPNLRQKVTESKGKGDMKYATAIAGVATVGVACSLLGSTLNAAGAGVQAAGIAVNHSCQLVGEVSRLAINLFSGLVPPNLVRMRNDFNHSNVIATTMRVATSIIHVPLATLERFTAQGVVFAKDLDAGNLSAAIGGGSAAVQTVILGADALIQGSGFVIRNILQKPDRQNAANNITKVKDAVVNNLMSSIQPKNPEKDTKVKKEVKAIRELLARPNARTAKNTAPTPANNGHGGPSNSR